MQERILAKEYSRQFLDRIIARGRTVAPVRDPSGYDVLRVVRKSDEVALDSAFSYYSPKPFLLPPYETLFSFTKTDGSADVKPLIEAEPTVFFGMHPCDINALLTYDAVFSAEPADEHFLTRRRLATIVGINCLRSCDAHSFCRDMKTMSAAEGFDLMLTDIGNAYFVQVATDRGAELLGDAPEASTAQKEEFQRIEKEKVKAFNHRIEYDTAELPARLAQSYDSLIWEAASRRCYSCGSCVLVCPTCYCFDVDDRIQMNLADGERKRYWDGCMLEGFARVAGGENFRPEKSQRLRHRLFRKGKFIPELFNRPGCVGCGRCERACTAKISIVATYNQLKGGF